ncbi:MAG: hypothetical protein H0T52_05955 [Lautropia sp.]|nr:hypothetical protein [Lautropia sp.]
MSKADPFLGPQDVRNLAAYADLPLAPGREEAILPVLRAWLTDANALSRKMSAAEHWNLTPAITFIHPSIEEGEG